MDETKMMEFVGQAVGDVGAVLGGAMVVIGDKLGLYRAMAGAGPLTPTELAGRTGTAERYVREWLSAQAARGYVHYQGDGRYPLPDEHRRRPQARRRRRPRRPGALRGRFGHHVRGHLRPGLLLRLSARHG